MAAEKPVDERHDSVLRTILALDPGPELPQELREAYWRIKHPMDRIGGQLSDADLVRIALDAYGDIEVDSGYSFLELLPQPLDTIIEVRWRNKYVPGFFKRIKGGDVIVILDDDTAEERTVSPKYVRLPKEK